MSPRKKLRELLQRRKLIVTPGITTALQAMMVEKAGFDFVYVGGYDVSLTLLGLPDVGLLTGTEMLANARNIARVVSLPVMADIDTGYGNVVNTVRTVRDFEAAGVAAIHIEDQTFPKRCGHVAGKSVIPLEEAVGKLKAALEARQDRNFVIAARTDAVAVAGGSLDEAIRRSKAFARAGCDIAWCEFPAADLGYARRFAEEMRRDFPNLPLYLDYSSNLDWRKSGATFDDFAEMGYRMMHVSLVGLRTTIQATWDYAAALNAHGARAEIDFHRRYVAHPMGELHRAGLAEAKSLEKKYVPESGGAS